MLTRLYRYGATKQAVLKSYIVHGENASMITREAARIAPYAVGNSVFTVRTFPRSPSAVWLDAGTKSLHSRCARDEFWREFAGAVNHLADKIKVLGGVLLPNAARPTFDTLWRGYLCDDIHILETADESETAVFCNLLRTHLPSLIALTGNAGVTGNKAHRAGSRRLSENIQQFTPHHLVSASSSYLKRVAACLRNDYGVQDLNFLDVYPQLNQSGEATAVVIRFNDGQNFLSTVRAQAILYQALFISARRRARIGGIPLLGVDHKILLRNRARAIAEGQQARFEPEPIRENRQGGSRGNSQKKQPPVRPAAVLLELFEQLRNEFQTLEVSYDELAPIVLGLTLRRMGHPGLSNESDWLRMLQRGLGPQNADLLGYLSQTISDQDKAQDLKFWNEKMFSASAQEVREWWERFLYVAA